MKINEKKSVIMEGTGKTIVQSISARNISRATYFMRDRIYTDKLKAALCETICNAVDEHRKHNVERPVDILVLNKEVVVRDYAAGLDDDTLCSVFFQYLESTKDTENDSIGGFGIGAKAPGAYSNIYYVESYHNGRRALFASVVQGYESVVTKVHEEPCDGQTGIAVRIPYNSKDLTSIKTIVLDMYRSIGGHEKQNRINIQWYPAMFADYDEFRNTTDRQPAETLFYPYQSQVAADKIPDVVLDGSDGYIRVKWFNYRMCDLINTDITTDKLIVRKDSIIIYRASDSLMNYSMFNDNVMFYDGDMMYKATLTKEQTDIIEKMAPANYSYYGRSNKDRIIFMFKRGELQVSPSREHIEQSDQLTGFIRKRINPIIKEIRDVVVAEHTIKIKAGIFKPWYDIDIYNDKVLGSLKHSCLHNSKTINDVIGERDTWRNLFYGFVGVEDGTRISGTDDMRRYDITLSGSQSKFVPVNSNGTRFGNNNRYESYRYNDLRDIKLIVIGTDLPRTKVAVALDEFYRTSPKAMADMRYNHRLFVSQGATIVQIKDIDMAVNHISRSANQSTVDKALIKSILEANSVSTEELLKYIPENEEEEIDNTVKVKVKTVKKLFDTNEVQLLDNEYTNTVIVKKSDLYSYDVCRLFNRGYPAEGLTDSAKKLLGKNFIAPVGSSDIKYWTKRGCVELDMEKVKALAAEILRYNNVVVLGDFTSTSCTELCDNLARIPGFIMGTWCDLSSSDRIISDKAGNKYTLKHLIPLLMGCSDNCLYSMEDAAEFKELYNKLSLKVKICMLDLDAYDTYIVHYGSGIYKDVYEALKTRAEDMRTKLLTALKPTAKAIIKLAKDKHKKSH